ncbi:hypothetical protein BKA70DRAFT_1576550 [Coprinopsis sp. MPI-PUGE-AT-0042]|nr:hypothetical protein BKA70DRAFT_1576550 [Coprinopsis sp. MPI-PUGE-AT-0042]
MIRTRITTPPCLGAGKIRVIFTILALNHFSARLLMHKMGWKSDKDSFPECRNEFLHAGEAQDLVFAIEGKPDQVWSWDGNFNDLRTKVKNRPIEALTGRNSPSAPPASVVAYPDLSSYAPS